MNIRMAAVEDTSLLIKLRMDYLQSDRGALPEAEDKRIRRQLENYFPSHINKDFIACLAEDEGVVLSVAYLVITEKPANPSFITGKTATLLNVLTYPKYRRQGIAKRVITRIIEEARRMEVSSIDLSATADGKPLYEKLGFTDNTLSRYTPMKLRL